MLPHPLRSSVLAAVAAASLAAGCAETAPTGPSAERQVSPSALASSNAAATSFETFSVPAPPIQMIVSCLESDNTLRVQGTWNGWSRITETANGHLHITEHVDWSEVRIVSTGGRTWLPGPGAHESFTFNVAVTADDRDESAHNLMHSMHGTFLSQDGASDLQVSHSIHRVVGPDLVVRRNEFVAFSADCLGQAG